MINGARNTHNGVTVHTGSTYYSSNRSPAISFSERKQLIQYFIGHYQVMESFKTEALEVLDNPKFSDSEKIQWIKESLNNGNSVIEEAENIADEL